MLGAISRGKEYLVSKNQFRRCVLLIWDALHFFGIMGCRAIALLRRGNMGRGCIIGGVMPVI